MVGAVEAITAHLDELASVGIHRVVTPAAGHNGLEDVVAALLSVCYILASTAAAAAAAAAAVVAAAAAGSVVRIVARHLGAVDEAHNLGAVDNNVLVSPIAKGHMDVAILIGIHHLPVDLRAVVVCNRIATRAETRARVLGFQARVPAVHVTVM
eukprot:3153032-Rhodomonas_salina.1